MKTNIVICRRKRRPARDRLVLATLALGLLVWSFPAAAAESASFRLYDSSPNQSDPSPSGSDSFSLDESGVTWTVFPVASTSFQIVTAPPSSASSSSVSSAAAPADAGSSSAPSQPAGGRRLRPAPAPLHPAPFEPPAASSSSRASAISVQPDDETFDADVESEDVVYGDGGQRELFDTLHPAGCTDPSCVGGRSWMFGGVGRAGALPTSWPLFIGALCAALQVLLLLRIFRPRSCPRVSRRIR